jgi:hypothetical protein
MAVTSAVPERGQLSARLSKVRGVDLGAGGGV